MDSSKITLTHEAKLRVPGLGEPLRVLHLTDTHLCLVDEEGPDEGRRANCRQRRNSWPSSEDFAHRFARVLSELAPKFDLLLLTGDIVDSPTRASLSEARKQLESCGTPWIYIPGNHDWNFPGEAPDATLRVRNYPRLAPLFGANAPSPAYRVECRGIQFLALDNSTYQIEGAQLEFVQSRLATGQPTVVLLHIPLFQPRLAPLVVARWGAPIMQGADFSPVQRATWRVEPDEPATPQFATLLRETPHLLAIFCGHVHFSHAEPFGHAVQFVGAPGFEWGCNAFSFDRP